MKADDKRHGTEAGHETHIRDGETPCPPCADAKLRASRRRWKRKTMGYKYTLEVGDKIHRQIVDLYGRNVTYRQIGDAAGVTETIPYRVHVGGPGTRVYARTWLALANLDLTGITTPQGMTRRLRALARLGYSVQRLATETGIHRDTLQDIRLEVPEYVAAKVKTPLVAIYDELHMTPATGATQQARAGVTRLVNQAIREGWAPPLAWNNIDLDDAPRGIRKDWHTGPGHDSFDHAVVERILAGERIDATKAERVEALRRWVASGRSAKSLETLQGWKQGRYSSGREAA